MTKICWKVTGAAHELVADDGSYVQVSMLDPTIWYEKNVVPFTK